MKLKIIVPAKVFSEETSLDCFSAACRTATRYFGKRDPVLLSSSAIKILMDILLDSNKFECKCRK